jgi:hypothetical protein
MTSIQQQIQEASSKNSQLLAGLHETDSAPSQLYQQITYIKDLDLQLKKSEKQVAQLKKKTASELEDHKKYSESTFRRFAHKASGRKERFAEKAEKEEREYFDAIQAQKTAEDDLAYVRQLKAEAEVTRAEYEQNALRHDSLQTELDALYNSIFAGYTPGFPDEDQKEQSVEATNQHCAEINQALEKERQLGYLLKQMMNKLTQARNQLDNAHSMSTYDMFGGGTLASMQKRNYLENAESAISQVRMLQDQVKQIDSSRGNIGPMNIASGSIWGDVVFDNIFSDMEMHDKIKQSEAQIQTAIQKLQQQINTSEEKERKTNDDLQRGSEMLKQARVELQKARERAFERVQAGDRIDPNAAEEMSTDAPPAYSV